MTREHPFKVHICPSGSLWELRDFRLIGACLDLALVNKMFLPLDRKRIKELSREVEQVCKAIDKERR